MQKLFIGNFCNNEMEILDLNNEMLATEKIKTKIYKKNPSYICIYNDFLYSVAEIQDNTVNSGYVLAYKIINNIYIKHHFFCNSFYKKIKGILVINTKILLSFYLHKIFFLSSCLFTFLVVVFISSSSVNIIFCICL